MSYVPEHVEHPDAWLNAKAARIRANKAKTNRRLLDVAIANDGDDFRAWLFQTTTPAMDAMIADANSTDVDIDLDDESTDRRYAAYHRARAAFLKRYGRRPDMIDEALQKWGGLTEKQLAFARRIFAERLARAEGRDAIENARRASAPHWTTGRQTFTGTIQSVRVEEIQFGWRKTTTVKGLVTLGDGRKVWASLPKAAVWIGVDESLNQGPKSYEDLKGLTLTMTATITPSDDDPTMGFAKRPTIGAPKKATRTPRQPRNATNVAPTTETTGDDATTRDAAKREAKRARAAARRARQKAIADAPDAYGYRLD